MAQTYIYFKTFEGHILASKDGLPGISETADGLRNGKISISTFIIGAWLLEMFFKEETYQGIWVGLLVFRRADFVWKPFLAWKMSERGHFFISLIVLRRSFALRSIHLEKMSTRRLNLPSQSANFVTQWTCRGVLCLTLCPVPLFTMLSEQVSWDFVQFCNI